MIHFRQQHLPDLDGCQRLARIGIFDSLLRISRVPNYEYLMVSHGGMLNEPGSAEAIEQAASTQREALLDQQGFVDYVGRLAQEARSVVRTGKILHAQGLGSTALSQLFADQHGIDLSLATLGDPESFSLSATVRSLRHQFYDVVGMTYNAPGLGWALTADVTYGFVNMRCAPGRYGLPPPPLTGAGNIAHMEGVEQALAVDMQTLVAAVTRRPHVP